MNPDPIVEPDETEPEKPIRSRDDWLSRYSRVMARFVPDAISTVAIMVVILFVLALALGNATLDAWYRGLWMLLPFTMQMTLVVVLGCVLAATPLFRRIVVSISKLPRTSTQVIIASVLVVAAISYLNWGLALALGPIVAVHFAGEAERRGIPIDFPFLLAVNGGAGSVWQFGLSPSGPLLMATSGHFLETSTGTMSLLSTIWSPAALALVVTFPVAVIFVARCRAAPDAQTSATALAVSLGLRNIRNFSRALQRAVVSCWPILVLYHLYGGVAGLIQFTTVGAAASDLVAPISTRWTFPLLTALAGTIVAIFVPSSGGQWVIQGFITIKAAEAAGVTAQRGMLALGVGDHMGKVVAPFWFLVRAEISRIDFRTFFGYGLIFALLWFVFGVAAFTFLPC